MTNNNNKSPFNPMSESDSVFWGDVNSAERDEIFDGGLDKFSK